MALATTLDDGTPLGVAGQWWELGQRLLDWARSGGARELLERHGLDPDGHVGI